MAWIWLEAATGLTPQAPHAADVLPPPKCAAQNPGFHPRGPGQLGDGMATPRSRLTAIVANLTGGRQRTSWRL
jgi:hypothetical protein